MMNAPAGNDDYKVSDWSPEEFKAHIEQRGSCCSTSSTRIRESPATIVSMPSAPIFWTSRAITNARGSTTSAPLRARAAFPSGII